MAIPVNSKFHSTLISHDIQPPFKSSNDHTAQAIIPNYTNLSDVLDTDEPNTCAGCKSQLKEGQALIALDRQWHINCFR